MRWSKEDHRTLMRFLKRSDRRAKAIEPATPASEPARPHLEPVAVFETEGILEGFIQLSDRRLSDVLNAGGPLQVQVATQVGSEWTDFNRDDVVAVSPPPTTEASPRRMSRRRHRLVLRADPYVISGTAHMPPGSDPIRYARHAPQRWLPLTKCLIAIGEEEWTAEVVIVNLDHVSRTEEAPTA